MSGEGTAWDFVRFCLPVDSDTAENGNQVSSSENGEIHGNAIIKNYQTITIVAFLLLYFLKQLSYTHIHINRK